jgi:hypothetical protein
MLGALPGIREIRAPLAAGYIWLLNLWLLTRAYDAETNNLSEAFFQLGQLTGTVSLSVAIGFAAYLLGSLTEGALLFLVALVTELRVSNRGKATLASVVAREMEGVDSSRFSEAEIEREFLRRRTTKRHLHHYDDLLEVGSRVRGKMPKGDIEDVLLGEMMDDLDLVKTRLLEEHKEVFSVSDRLNSEGDLRFAVIPPMILLAGVIAHEAWIWWLFPVFLVPILLIGLQAWARKRRGGDVLADALSLRLVEAPAAEDFALAVRELELAGGRLRGASAPENV